MSELESRFVYRGFWVNYKDGPIMGKTITTDTKTSTIIVALLAIMSSLGAAHLWNLLLFVFHQSRATGGPGDTLFRQQQAFIRTLPTPSSVVAEALNLWWLWKKKKGHTLIRCLVPAIISMAFAICSLFASIFSSFIVDTSDIEVLVQSPYCGFRNATRYWNDGDTADFDYSTFIESAGMSYARDCYRPAIASRCNGIFIQPNVAPTVQEVGCPFTSNMCAPNGSVAVAIDSGLLDVNQQFGFNLKLEDQIKFRRKTTCTVLPTNGYVRVANSSEFTAEQLTLFTNTPLFVNQSDQPYEVISYGGFFDPNGTEILPNVTALNSLWYAKSFARYEPRGIIHVNTSPDFRPYTSWKPRPELMRTDADISLLGITIGNIEYQDPVDDPLFSAHQAYTDEIDGVKVVKYRTDHHTGTLGCAIQYQFCAKIGKTESCTSLAGISENWQEELPGASDTQMLVMKILTHSSWFMDLSHVGELNASLTLTHGIRNALPNNQWKIEAVQQDSFVWAVLQILLTDYAIGAEAYDPGPHKAVEVPNTPAQKALCSSIRMRKSGGFANINVLGLSLVLTLACFFIILDLLLLRFLIYLSKFRRALTPRIDRWIQDGVFQLQRRAYQAYGQGTWERLDHPTPITVYLEELGDLPTDSNSETMAPIIAESPLRSMEKIAKVPSSALEIKTLSK